MKTKKIAAPTVTEAMGKVKKELGPDAIILYTRKIKKTHWLPPFKKEMVEIVAALDEEQKGKVESTDLRLPETKQPLREDQLQTFSQALERHIKEQKEPTQNTESLKASPKTTLLLERGGSELVGNDRLFPEMIKKIHNKLIDNDFYADLSDQLTRDLLKEWYSNSESLKPDQMKEKLSKLFEGQLKGNEFAGRQATTRLITLVGPTGVGKTTTAAKLASKVVLEEEKTVAFITTDTYRIAAVDQLKTYAKILNIPISVAYSMEDFQQALNQYKNYDLIIVDSAGRNYQQKKYVNELLQLIPFQNKMETYLVLSATSKIQDLERITSQFSTLPISSFLFTKLDETLSIGNLCQLVIKHRYGVTYFTNGQDVPDDILEADREAFIAQLVEGIIHE